MTKIAQPIAGAEDAAIYFTARNEKGVAVDWIDPVIGFTEYDDYWAVENTFDLYLVKRKPGYTYTLKTMEVAS